MKLENREIKLDGLNLLVPLRRNELPMMSDFLSKNANIDVKKYRKSRSLSANSYCWVLCQEIAERLSTDGTYISKENVYRRAIKDCGHCTMINIKAQAAKSMVKHWQSHGIGWVADVIGSTGTEITLALYHGSSTYDTAEMARLINCLCDDAKQLEIKLRPDKEIEKMIKEWWNNARDKV